MLVTVKNSSKILLFIQFQKIESATRSAISFEFNKFDFGISELQWKTVS